MPLITVEVIPWLTDYLAPRPTGRAAWEEEIPAGATVRDALVQLFATRPKLATVTYDHQTTDLTGVVNLALNDRLLELAGGLNASLADGDRLTLIPAYAGGSVAEGRPVGRY